MRVDLLLKIAGVGLLTTVVCQILTRAGREDVSTLAAVAGLVIVLTMVLSLVSELFTGAQAIFGLM